MKAVADSKVHGIDAKNQDFIRFDQVNKQQGKLMLNLEPASGKSLVATFNIGRRT
jgi:hypothetical protein